MTCRGWYFSRDRGTKVLASALCWGDSLKNNITPLEVGTAPFPQPKDRFCNG